MNKILNWVGAALNALTMGFFGAICFGLFLRVSEFAFQIDVPAPSGWVYLLVGALSVAVATVKVKIGEK